MIRVFSYGHILMQRFVAIGAGCILLIYCTGCSGKAQGSVYKSLPDPCSLVSSATATRLTGAEVKPSPGDPLSAGQLRQSSCSWTATPSDGVRAVTVYVGFHVSHSAGDAISTAKRYFRAGECAQSGWQCGKVSGIGDEAYREFITDPTPKSGVVFRLRNLVVQAVYHDTRMTADSRVKASSQYVVDQDVVLAKEVASRLPKVPR